jgi:DNA-binding NtrC family response regulator
MVTRGIASDLVRLLDTATEPLYVLDESARILFANDACAAWAGCAAAELVGQECRYHSSGEVPRAESIAAALAPPPEVWTGRRVAATVSLVAADGQLAARHVDFLPLGNDAVNVAGVIALASARIFDTQAADAREADREEDSARELHDRVRHWRRQLAGRFHMDRLIGESPAMGRVRNQVELAAASTASVSITGPAGSGRQHAARAIHYGRAAQSAGALVPLACPVLSTSLLESTIRALVRASIAEPPPRPATLLLADVDELPLDVQEHLARCLPAAGAVRIVSTARESLLTLAATGKFRPELACGLATVDIELVPLAERVEDLPLLAQMFVEDENRHGKKQLAGFTPEALDRLAAHPWPGNVAELASVVSEGHRAAEGPHIGPGDLPAKIHLAREAASHPRKIEDRIVLEEFLAGIEEELIRRALARAKGNKTKAARLLGMTRPRLYRRLVQLGLEKPEE